MNKGESVIYIDVHSSRTRVAVMNDDELVEFMVEKNNQSNKCVGNIYKGKVMNVLNGMQASFVNIGLEKNAYLYVGDSLVDKSDLPQEVLEKVPANLSVNIGDVIMAQVIKDQSGTKGARITADVTIPGRFLVYMPYMDYIGISRKIEDEALREKLYKIVDGIREQKTGFIVRTAAATASAKEIKQDAKFLIDTFKTIQEKFELAGVSTCVYSDGDLIFRTIRDIYTSETAKIISNSQEVVDYVKEVLFKIAPKNRTEVSLYDGTFDMFKFYKIDEKVEQLLQKKIWLKNGAYLIMDKTEALTVIDVNTGKFVGNDNLEETVFITNMLAAREIARQLRVRNVGGIVVVDFIDMHNEEHRDRVVAELNEHLKYDRIKSTVVDMTALGLVEITRKKSRNETSTFLTQRCPYCNGDGVIYSNEYMLMKIRAGLLDEMAKGSTSCVLTVNPSVMITMFKQRAFSVDASTIWQTKRIYVIPDETFHIRDFKIEGSTDDVLTLPATAQLLY